MKFKIKLLSILLLLFCSVSAQENIKKLDQILNKIHTESPFPGFAVAIVKDNNVVFTNSYGFADRKNKIPFTENTILPIASVSKTFIGFALVKAMEMNYFTMETAINNILPFEVINPYHPHDSIKIKHLFTHTSTITDDENLYKETYLLEKRSSVKLKTFLEGYLSKNGDKYAKSNFDLKKPGNQYIYSNIASALAAYTIEAASKMPFDQFTQKYLFDPLELKSTHWFYNDTLSREYATLYEIYPPKAYKRLLNRDNSLKTYSTITYPDGGLRSSLSDLTKYVIELLNGYDGASELLTKNSYQQLFRKQFDEEHLPNGVENNLTNQAVFWYYNSKKRLTHTGSDPGVYTVISLDFKTKTGRIVLINANIDTEDNEEIVSHLRDIANALE